jgi:hypothetical protein
MTAFNVGSRVVSRINEQNLTKGQEYTVEDVISNHQPFGTFVTYVLADDAGDRFAVGNGHLVLGRAEGGK